MIVSVDDGVELSERGIYPDTLPSHSPEVLRAKRSVT
jgi:hypothetical protein